MPCTACGTSNQNKKSFQLNKPKQETNQKIVYLTQQQIAAIQMRLRSCRRTLVFT
mgnify:FL=1